MLGRWLNAFGATLSHCAGRDTSYNANLPTLSSPAPPILWPPVTSSEAYEKQVCQNLARAIFPIFVLTIGYVRWLSVQKDRDTYCSNALQILYLQWHRHGCRYKGYEPPRLVNVWWVPEPRIIARYVTPGSTVLLAARPFTHIINLLYGPGAWNKRIYCGQPEKYF